MKSITRWIHRAWRKTRPSDRRKPPCRGCTGPESHAQTEDLTSHKYRPSLDRAASTGPQAKDPSRTEISPVLRKPVPKRNPPKAPEPAVVAHSSERNSMVADRVEVAGNICVKPLKPIFRRQSNITTKPVMVDSGTQTTDIEDCEGHSRGSLHLAPVVESRDRSTRRLMRILTAFDASKKKHSVIPVDTAFSAAVVEAINAGRAILELKLKIESQQQAAREFSVKLERKIEAYTRLLATGAETNGTSMSPVVQRTIWAKELEKLKLLFRKVTLEQEDLERTLTNHVNMYIIAQGGALAFVEDAFINAQLVP